MSADFLITTSELSKKFGIKFSWIRKHLSEIPHYKIKGILRFDPDQVKIWLEQFQKGGNSEKR